MINDLIFDVDAKYVHIQHAHLAHLPITRWTWAGLAIAGAKSRMYKQLLITALERMSRATMELAT